MKTRTCTRPPGSSVAGTVSLAVLAVGLVLTASDVPLAWLVWPLGYGVALPLAIGYAKRDRRESDNGAETDQLAEAKRQYVDGDIDELEFETALEDALEDDER